MKTETDKEYVSSFSAMVMFLDDGEEETFDVELSKPVEELTYDEVENAICQAVDEKYGYTAKDFEDEDYVPYNVIDIVVNEGGESYPVVPEDADIEKLKAELNTKKFLVLPWAMYGLTPECKLWMKMRESGVLADDAEFDYDKMHKLVKVLDENCSK